MEPPIDPGYTGEIGVYIYNSTYKDVVIEPGSKVGQLLVVPVIYATFTTDDAKERGNNREGSTGTKANNASLKGV